MTIPEIQQARDYNRGLPAPIRWVHVLWAVGLWFTRPIREWTGEPRRRDWAVPLVWGVVVALVIGNFDGALARLMHAGESRAGTADMFVSYAVLAISVLGIAVIAIQDPAKRARLADWAAAFIAAALVCRLTSMLIGRPRPSFGDPAYFVSPFGRYPISPESGVRHAWEFWVRGVPELWSFPARDVAFIFVAAAAVVTLYPALRVLLAIFAVAASLAVLALGGHYLSDVVMGGAIGLACGRVAMHRRWGRMFRPLSSATPPG